MMNKWNNKEMRVVEWCVCVKESEERNQKREENEKGTKQWFHLKVEKRKKEWRSGKIL